MLRRLLSIHGIITGQHHVRLSSTLLATSGKRAGWLQGTRQVRYIKAVHSRAVCVREPLPITDTCHRQPNTILQPVLCRCQKLLVVGVAFNPRPCPV